ncbi:hypothetical protein BC827DRAFT_1158480 [Russula dissimulans]|nr:hypothetical protein BC827DRAFT_1158480 [Russula dissimulans]
MGAAKNRVESRMGAASDPQNSDQEGCPQHKGITIVSRLPRAVGEQVNKGDNEGGSKLKRGPYTTPPNLDAARTSNDLVHCRATFGPTQDVYAEEALLAHTICKSWSVCKTVMQDNGPVPAAGLSLHSVERYLDDSEVNSACPGENIRLGEQSSPRLRGLGELGATPPMWGMETTRSKWKPSLEVSLDQISAPWGTVS